MAAVHFRHQCSPVRLNLVLGRLTSTLVTMRYESQAVDPRAHARTGIRLSPVRALAPAGAVFGATLGLAALWYFDPFVGGDGADAAFIMVSLVSLPTSVVLGLLFELVGSSRIAAVAYLMLAPVLNWALICTGLGLVITRYRRENGGSGDGSLR